MTAELPRFQKRQPEQIEAFLKDVLSRDDKDYLLDSTVFQDGHYRALFDPAYFHLAEGHSRPSKSQWSTLKKKFKRHDPRIFVFKEYGYLSHQGQEACYLDFGFFAGEQS